MRRSESAAGLGRVPSAALPIFVRRSGRDRRDSFCRRPQNPLEKTNHRATLVTVYCKQSISDLDAPCRWARAVDVRNIPGSPVRPLATPTGNFLNAVVTSDSVGGEREQAGVDDTRTTSEKNSGRRGL